MTPRITTNQIFNRSLGQMGALNAQADKLQGQIATNKRFTAPSEDVAAYQRLAGLQRAASADAAASANVKLAGSLIDQADSTLASMETQLQRAQELATQAASGTLNDSQRATLSTALDGILTDLVNLANATDLRGQPMFGGADGATPFVQDANGVRYVGTGTPPAIPIGDGSSVQASDSGDRLFMQVPAADGTTTNMFKVIGDLAAARKSGADGAAASSDALAGIKASLGGIAGARASFGARGARLELEADRLADVALDREAMRSDLEDVDVETTIVELQKTLTVLQATQASFTKLSSLSLFDYLR